MTSTNAEKKKKKTVSATAIHAEHKDGVHHIVGLGNIRVLLIPEGEGWFAQGLEIDYAAQGEDLESVKTEFEAGLEATVQEHLRIKGDINTLLKCASKEFWDLASDPKVHLKRYSQVTHHHVIRENSKYEGIAYLVAQSAAAA